MFDVKIRSFSFHFFAVTANWTSWHSSAFLNIPWGFCGTEIDSVFVVREPPSAGWVLIMHPHESVHLHFENYELMNAASCDIVDGVILMIPFLLQGSKCPRIMMNITTFTTATTTTTTTTNNNNNNNNNATTTTSTTTTTANTTTTTCWSSTYPCSCCKHAGNNCTCLTCVRFPQKWVCKYCRLTLLLSVTCRKTSDIFYFKFPSFDTHSFRDNDLVNHPTSAPSDNLITHLFTCLFTYLIFLLNVLTYFTYFFTYILTNYLLSYTLTPWSRVLPEKHSGSQSRNFPHFMEPEGSLLLLHVPATSPYVEPDQSNPCPPPHLTSWRSILILFSHLRLSLPSGLFPSGPSPQKPVRFFPLPHMCYMLRPSFSSRFDLRSEKRQNFRTQPCCILNFAERRESFMYRRYCSEPQQPAPCKTYFLPWL